jgi:GNAT superfamily N-acetyltransferase
VTFAQFIESDFRNLWIRQRYLTAYVRKSKRYINQHLVECFDIGDVGVDERHRRKGVFRRFLKEVEDAAAARGRVVFVESVMNPVLEEYLVKMGYTYDPRYYHPAPSLWKTPKNSGKPAKCLVCP